MYNSCCRDIFKYSAASRRIRWGQGAKPLRRQACTPGTWLQHSHSLPWLSSYMPSQRDGNISRAPTFGDFVRESLSEDNSLRSTKEKGFMGNLNISLCHPFFKPVLSIGIMNLEPDPRFYDNEQKIVRLKNKSHFLFLTKLYPSFRRNFPIPREKIQLFQIW